MRKSEKMGMRILETVFNLVLPVIAVCLLCVLASPDAMCAADDDFLISLPTKKNEANNKTSASSPKKEKVLGAVAAEDMLQGVFYDLKQTRNHRPNKDFSAVSTDGEYVNANLNPTLKVVQSFVNGTWQKSNEINGRVNYSALNAYYSPTNKVWISSFYIGDTSSITAPQAFGCPEDVKPNCWICIYSGYIVAPFSGQFRFVGFGDDFLVVRINRDIVFDYGRISATLGVNLDPEKRSSLTAAGSEKSQPSKNPIERIMPTINRGESGSSFYSKNKLVIRSPEYMNTASDFGCGLANGSIISVRQGEVIPIEILVGDVGGKFNYVLFVERLDTNGKVLYPDKPLQLFRTSEELPPSFSDDAAVAYDKNSPIWKVVDSRGKPIPSHNPSVTKKDGPSDVGAKSSSGGQEKQTSVQPENDPKPKRTVKTTKQGNLTTQTVTENNGDTTVETVTMIEVNGDTTTQTTVVTETKNGKVVKKTTSTTTTTTENLATKTDENPASSSGTSTEKASSDSKTDSTTKTQRNNPFGYLQQLPEDEE
ncbi:MAG: hypothetical protein J6Y92_08650 [Lentisphaeria bacterium]|nr:hypothetical protein [Lentisphaeria bacterium]